ncbi:hypothetical protein GGX14DRAFT_393576 [Mycena pura]|uniref:DUF6534 domain-containing protein n=1 Tax=Mycena pura TaxID=153505 RepID=A0AAD6VH58_9AGAR|nr:hypothetical protein GGX14DRAFT_393576 [Mycena pura]
MPSMGIVAGPLLIGSWANSALVVTVWFIDTVDALGNYASVYLYTITHAGDQEYLANQNWTVPLLAFTSSVVAVLVQSFLVVRYWRFRKNIIVTMFLFILILVTIGASFTVGVVIARFPSFSDRGKIRVPGTVWLVAQAVTDLGIALALLWEFSKVKTTSKETRCLLNQLVTRTIQTGTAGATVAVAALIAYLVNDESNGAPLRLRPGRAHQHCPVAVGIAYCLGRVYVLTMLLNLNTRNPATDKSGALTDPSCIVISNEVYLRETKSGASGRTSLGAGSRTGTRSGGSGEHIESNFDTLGGIRA